MIDIQISDDYLEEVNSEWIDTSVKAVMNQIKPDMPYTDSVVVDSDEMIQGLNKDYLGINSPTDVLSFPSGETEPEPDSEAGEIYLGDIIISFPRAGKQAAAAGHPVQSELMLLTVHGMLHLLGFDHAEIEEKALMWKIQADILSKLGVDIRRLPEE